MHKLALLISLDLEIARQVRAVNVDDSIDSRNYRAISLLHRHVPAELTVLGRNQHAGAKHESNAGEER
jgi:hypothetical protein